MGIAPDSRHQFVLRKGPVPCFMIFATAAIGFVGCDDRPNGDPNSKPAPDSKQMLNDKYDLIEMNMTEAQVDQIFAGHPRGIEQVSPKVKEGIRSFERNSSLIPSFHKFYDEKPNAIEHDFYIDVTFNEAHLVINKYLGEYIK